MYDVDSIFYSVFRGIGGGNRVAVLISAYFDESAEGHSKDGLLSVSGYVLDDDGIIKLVPEWQKMLKDYRLNYFRMSECNTPSVKDKGGFGDLTRDECDLCAREAIRIARSYPIHGRAFVLDQTEYKTILQDCGFDCDPYTFMVWSAFSQINRWILTNKPDHKMSLFFEDGYHTKKRSNELLEALSNDSWGGRNRITSYSFVKKEESEPTQAADLVAWHVRKVCEYQRDGKAVRTDSKAIFKDKETWTVQYTPTLLHHVSDELCKKAGNLENAARLIFSDEPPVPS